MNLEFRLGVKAGIGHNFTEADVALTEAKKLKEQISPHDPPEVAQEKSN